MHAVRLLGTLMVVAAVGLACGDDGGSPAAPEYGPADGLFAPPEQAQGQVPAAKNFVAPLDWREEVPPVAVATNATGLARFQLGGNGDELDFKLIVANIENVTQAHIHRGPAGVAGPVVVWLYPDGPPAIPIPGRTNGILSEGTITEADFVGPLAGEPFDVLLDLIHEGEAYVNVHTQQNPPGEIRGQIRVAGPKR